MKKILVAGIAAATFGGAPVLAADMPVKAPLAAPFNWTGFYAGLNGGYGWGRTGIQLDFVDANTRGGFLGGQVGFNQQLGNNFVIGAQLDLDWSRIKGQKIEDSPGGDEIYQGQIKYFGTARVRAGVTQDRTFIYGTGGIAWGKNSVRAGIDPMFFSASANHTGTVVGVGGEHYCTPTDSLSLEYLHINLGTKDYDLGGPYGIQPIHVRFDSVRVSWNHHY